MDINFNKNEDHNKMQVSFLHQKLQKIYEGGGKKSAEKQKEVFTMQCFLYPQWKLYPAKASYALYMEKPFDFIWLDFFGSAFEGDNWASVIQASRKINDGGALCVTSGHRNSLGGVYDYKAKFNLLKLNIEDVKTYINNGMKMSLFTLTN